MKDRTAGLSWLTSKRHAAFESRDAGIGFENNRPELWQSAIDTLAHRPWPAQVSEEELDLLPYDIAVHIPHCCADHGCEYGYDDCAVMTGIVQQEQRCKKCYERQERMEKILRDLEDAAVKAFPETDFRKKGAVLADRDAFKQGARWAAGQEGIISVKETEVVPTREALVAWMHNRQIFEYDKCDHGTYSGGAMNGQPYAMCERWAEALLESGLLFPEKKI